MQPASGGEKCAVVRHRIVDTRPNHRHRIDSGQKREGHGRTEDAARPVTEQRSGRHPAHGHDPGHFTEWTRIHVEHVQGAVQNGHEHRAADERDRQRPVRVADFTGHVHCRVPAAVPVEDENQADGKLCEQWGGGGAGQPFRKVIPVAVADGETEDEEPCDHKQFGRGQDVLQNGDLRGPNDIHGREYQDNSAGDQLHRTQFQCRDTEWQ
jgi:hypothetical protein